MYEIKEFKSITLPFIPHTVHEIDQNGINGVADLVEWLRWGITGLETTLSAGLVNSTTLVCSEKTNSFKAYKGDITL